MRTGSVSFSASALQPHRWAVGLSYHRSRIPLFFRIANADVLASQIAIRENKVFFKRQAFLSIGLA